MSYRSFKRVLGETSLERKCRLLFGGCLLVLITGSFLLYGERTVRLVHEQNREKARSQVDTVMLKKHFERWVTDDETEKLVKAMVDVMDTEEYISESIYPLVNHPKPDQVPKNYDYDDKGDRYEWDLLRDFAAEEVHTTEDGQEIYQERQKPKLGEYHYYQPFYASKSCVLCHRTMDNNPNLAEGDLIAIVQIRIPTGKTTRAIRKNRALLLAMAIITVFLAMVLLYIIVRYVIVKPLKHLRDVSDEITRGNIDLRADIHTNDEFEELAAAFNRMIRQLTDAQGDLRDVNDNLAGKVDELAQANMRLYESNRVKSDFLATMSHELRTPLNSIIGFSDVLDSIERLDDKQRRYVQNIQTSGRLLLEMINDILDLAKIESGRMRVNLTDFRMDSIISAQCDMARPLAEQKNIDLESHVQADLPSIYQDQSKIQQILNNLLSNAIKFTPEGGRIEVAARRDARGLMEMTVTDTGVGIAEEDRRTIFEKFRQGQTVLSGGDAMTREYSGTGLGLSIVKEICKLLGGEVTLESELGKGSTFFVRLPWRCEEQPQLDSSLADELGELTNPYRTENLPRRESLLPGPSESN